MDQQSVESLLRCLVQRVEESERRYSEALDELHARLDQLSQTTAAARTADSAEDAETFDRLHDQVSSLARRLEQESETSLDDFERLGRALSGELEHGAAMSEPASKPDLLSELAASSFTPSEPPLGGRFAPYGYALPEPDHSAPPLPSSYPGDDRDLDKRLVEMAHRLEQSIGTAMPAQALEALNARLDEIGAQLAKALDQAPKRQALEAVERQIADMAQQLGQAEAGLAKIGEIESALYRLVERVDASASQLEEVASKAASEAAQRVAEEAKLSAGTAERLDAMHRDLMAVNDRVRASDDRLAATIEAVHESLRKLVQLVEQNATPAKPRLPFAERMRQLEPLPASAEARPEFGQAPKNGEAGPPAKERSFKNRLGAAIPDFQETKAAPPFGRAKGTEPEAKTSDLDHEDPARALAKGSGDELYATPDDLVAAARRAAQAAAMKAEERASGSRVRRVAVTPDAVPGGENASRRKRSFLIICAAVLLATSALLLYGRLRSKPEPEIVPPAAEESAPLPSAPSEGSEAPGTQESAPPAGPNSEAPAPRLDPFQMKRGTEVNPGSDAVGEIGQEGNFTDVAKSSFRLAAASEAEIQPEPAALKPIEAPALPPGVVFSIEDPGPCARDCHGHARAIAAEPPLAAARARSAFLARGRRRGRSTRSTRDCPPLAQGQGTPQNLTEAARWLERAAGAGLAPAARRHV